MNNIPDDFPPVNHFFEESKHIPKFRRSAQCSLHMLTMRLAIWHKLCTERSVPCWLRSAQLLLGLAFWRKERNSAERIGKAAASCHRQLALTPSLIFRFLAAEALIAKFEFHPRRKKSPIHSDRGFWANDSNFDRNRLSGVQLRFRGGAVLDLRGCNHSL